MAEARSPSSYPGSPPAAARRSARSISWIPVACLWRRGPDAFPSLQFPYGGAGPEFDPACYPADAVPVQSYRHSHYGKERVGLTLDGDWFGELAGGGNRLRAGLWAEDGRRDLGRDWHKVVDARVSHHFDETPYWHQYDWEFPQSVIKWYVEDTLFAGPLAMNAGVRQYLVEVGRRDLFGETAELSVSSDSDLLLSGGLTYTAPIRGLELFAGYAQNFKSLSDRLLEVPGRSLEGLEPETADNLDIGFRYTGDRFAATATYYRIDFQNRIFFLSPQTAAGPNYLIAGGGSYFNAGGIDSRGVELSATLRVTESTSFYTAWTRSDATYVGTGDPLVSVAQGIRPGSQVVGIPRTLVVVSADHSGDPIAAGFSAKYTAARGVSLDGSWNADAYWLLDAYFRWSAGRISPRLQGLEIALIGNNLLDRTYPRHHQRPGRFPRRAANRLAERDCLVLTGTHGPHATGDRIPPAHRGCGEGRYETGGPTISKGPTSVLGILAAARA